MTNEERLADILRRIVEKAAIGARNCAGLDATYGIVWKGSFRELLKEADQAVTAMQMPELADDVRSTMPTAQYHQLVPGSPPRP